MVTSQRSGTSRRSRRPSTSTTYWEKLKKQKEAWEAEQKELRHQLEEASIKIEAETIAGNERATKAEQ